MRTLRMKKQSRSSLGASLPFLRIQVVPDVGHWVLLLLASPTAIFAILAVLPCFKCGYPRKQELKHPGQPLDVSIYCKMFLTIFL